MIQANELRIGNYVQVGVLKCQINSIHTVVGLDETHYRVSGFIEADPQYCFNDYDVDPVPLTPEILEKTGLGFNDASGVFAWKFSPVGDVISVKCQYVHQLQNLYFILTGEELDIKFNK